jgi:predicted O-methyltransferase YrrM
VNWRDYLQSVDDSHQMTTAKSHIAEMCGIVEGKQWSILELGSHAGISAAAIAMAAPSSRVVSVDLSDTVPQSDRVSYWDGLGVAVAPVTADARAYLSECVSDGVLWDFIFHDAAHGDAVLNEYLTAASVCKVLAIHDWEQLSPQSQSAVSACFSRSQATTDNRGRTLFVGYV